MTRETTVPALLVVAVACLVFLPILGHPFVQIDDAVNVYENPYLRPFTAQGLWRFWTESYESLYIPLTYSVWMALAATAGLSEVPEEGPDLSAAPFHSANLLLHLANVTIVFLILRSVLAARTPGKPALRASEYAIAAAAGAALFAWHPMQVEPVAWVTGLKDVLSGFLGLLSLWLYLGGVLLEERDGSGARPPEKRRRRGRERGSRGGQAREGPDHASTSIAWRLPASFAAFALAVLAKPSAVCIPLVAIGLAWLVAGRPGSVKPAHLAAWALIGGPLVVLNKMLQSDAGMAYVAPLWARPLIAADAFSFYGWKTLFPVQIGPDYGRSAKWAVESSAYLRSIPPLLAAAALLAARRATRPLLACAAVSLAAVLPALGLVPFDFQTFSTVADRYFYLAMLGPACALALVLTWRPGGVTRACAAAVLSVLAIGSASQVPVWKDSEALFRHSISLTPESAWMRNNLGFALSAKGEYEAAREQLREALRIDPAHVDAHNNLGVSYAKQERYPEAMEQFRQALEKDPSSFEAHHNLGQALGISGAIEEAIEHFEISVQLSPLRADARRNLGIGYARQGRLAEAERQFEQAVELRPGDPRHASDLEKCRAQMRAREAGGTR